MTDADKERDQELAHRAKARLEQTGEAPKPHELAAIDRILIEQARQRLQRQQDQAASAAL